MKTLLSLMMTMSLLTGCATSVQPPQKSNLTPGMVNTKIVKGVTTQTEILEVFGAPNIMTKNKAGQEVWTYDKVSIDNSNKESYGTIILAGISGAKSSTSSTSFTLMLTFDDNQVVDEYSYRSSAF